MSLTTLTFGAKRNDFSSSPHVLISTPSSRVSQAMGKMASLNGKLLVKKACRFYSQENVFVLAEVAEGFIVENMKASLDNREIQIVEVESKYGNNAKKGMAVGVFLSGIDETELQAGSVLEFRSG